MTDYKPGTVALATVNSADDVQVMRVERNGSLDFAWVTPTCYHASDSEVSNIRPLVVLDLSTAPEQVSAWSQVTNTLRSGLSKTSQWLAGQIEAQTKPPKPAEPTGLGAVVEDSNGLCWVRDWAGFWLSVDRRALYDRVNAVRVLSEGVQS